MLKKNKIVKIIKEHVRHNIKEYSLVLLIFIVGIFVGVFFINNITDTQKEEITIYINDYINNLKTIEKLDVVKLLKNSILQNCITAILIWFFGTTVIGIPAVFGIIGYRGFSLGYTVSSLVTVLGMPQGLIFSIILLFFQNILFIPAILGLGVSGIKLYKSIIKDKRKENIKMEIVRHTIFSFVMLLMLILSSLIEIVVSTNILKLIINYF